MPDRSHLKLGRKAIKTDSRTLQMARYMTAALPPAPVSADWTAGITNWGMMLNDSLGCCTIAGVGHAIQVWTANTGTEITVPDPTILSYYEQWDGYVDGDPSTDQGGIEIDVLRDWQKNGFAGHKLLAFADTEARNLEHVRQAINLFGGVYIGLALPLSAQNQTVWSNVADDGTGNTVPGSWGGHCVFVPKYDENGFTCITWSELTYMTNGFWKKYTDEVHCPLSPDFIAANGLDPQHFNLQQLQTDLAAIR